MTDPMILAAASVLVIGAIAAATVKVVTAVGSMKRELLIVTTRTNVKAEAIHDLVNGSASKAAEKLAEMERQIATLHSQLEQLQERRVEDAKTRAAAGRNTDEGR